MENTLRGKLIDEARRNGSKYGKKAELDFGAGAEWMYKQLKEQLTLTDVSITFKAKINAKILELKTKLNKISEDVEMSFTEPENWKKEMHLINGEIEGLNIALNYC